MKKYILAGILVVIFLVILAIILSLAFSGETKPIWSTNKIGLIPIEGELVSVSEFARETDAYDIIELIDEADKDPNVGAILLEIQSPGGSVVATRQIVQRIKEVEKPIISWIGDLGASGGYYVAASTDYIISDPDSLTGSIGVISVVMNFKKLLDEFGVDVNIMTAGKYKSMLNPFRELKEDERDLFQTIIDEAYNEFKNDILRFRGNKINRNKFDEIADGRILSGRQAKEVGLVDELGTRKDAINKAAELAGIEMPPEVEEYAKKELSFLDLLTEAGTSFGEGLKNSIKTPNLSIKS